MLKNTLSSSPLFFDEVVNHIYGAPSMDYTNENLLMGDWAKGLMGTGKASFQYNVLPSGDALAGCLAESWEIVNDQTFVFHIRKGVYFHNKPPTNGRELNANDVVFSLKRLWEAPTHYYYQSFPWSKYLESIEAPDKWTVVVKTKPRLGGPIFEYAGDQSKIVPPEVIKQYGDLRDWRNACGTGAFMLVDYVADSSITFKRNPNYWGKDPLHPQNTLPYVDEVRLVIMTDLSSRLAAMRTGQVDRISGITWQDADNMKKTNPELKYLKVLQAGNADCMWPRLDKKLPWDDIKVRRALAMGIDRPAIVRDYYKGNAGLLVSPVPPIPEFARCYVPLEELPEATRQLFEYHPDTAKQLLAEAGYPNGFKTEILCQQSQVDMLSLVKSYWAKIGVDLKLDVKEYGAYASGCSNHTYPEMCIWWDLPTICYKFTRTVPGGTSNYAMINDPRINAAQAAVEAVYLDSAKRDEEMKKIVPYILEQAYWIQLPVVYAYAFWQPWLKGYGGEYTLGMYQYGDVYKHVWIDQELKDKMTGRK
jgi:peptide/nickel transport system substrate-binding protein